MGEEDRGGLPDPDLSKNRGGLPDLDLDPTRFLSRYYPPRDISPIATPNLESTLLICLYASGSVGRADTSVSRCTLFESSHRQS